MNVLVSHIQRGSVADGPGLRTTVYIKGCPLRCPWCFNAESLRFDRELRYVPQFCIGLENCDRCITACGCKALRAGQGNEKPVIMRDVCNVCGECARCCPGQALTVIGESLEPEKVVDLAALDSVFYETSSGGLTLSGGEPLVKPAFAARVLSLARLRGLDTAIETCGWFDLDDPDARTSLQNCNRLIFDLKHLDGQIHRNVVGLDNARILENLQRICREFPRLPIHVRTTVVRGFNDDPSAMRAMAFYVAALPNVTLHELLPCLGIGESKYSQLGHPQAKSTDYSPDEECFAELQGIIKDCRSHVIGENSARYDGGNS